MTDEQTLPTETILKLQHLKERFKTRLEATYKEIEKLQSDTALEKNLDELIHISHKLAGSSGTFGFPQLSIDMKTYELKVIEMKTELHLISQKDFTLLRQEALIILNNVLKH